MENKISEKFKTIIDWYAKNNREETRQLLESGSKEKIALLEQFAGKKLTDEFITLYSAFNGEEGMGMGIFLAHSFLSLEEIIQALELSKTFTKPENRTIDDPAAAERLILSIINEFRRSLPAETEWYKFEFRCSPGSLQYPYFFGNENTADNEKEMFSVGDEEQKNINQYVTQLHTLEKQNYNWDEIAGTVYQDGRYEVNREDFSFIADIPFTSFPEGAIKKKYFNAYWVPVIFDNSGNYIGIDLDPDTEGKVGQVIVFGRDEEDMFVIADTFEKFLDFNLDLIEKGGQDFLGGKHIHDIYKAIIIQ